MPNLFDYLAWRGDLSLGQAPFQAVDALVLSTLAYVQFRDILPTGPDGGVTIGQACRAFCALPEKEQRRRVQLRNDRKLARLMVDCPRFSSLLLHCHQETVDTRRQTQFAALSVRLDDRGEEAFVAFRGTDNNLVGWKEDFNMSFQEVVPAQEAALDYLAAFARDFPGKIRLGGHSKGGNLAVYAGSKVRSGVRKRIVAVYNHDGPGFWPGFLRCKGYRELLGRIETWVPQTSVVGMLLEREEPHAVVKSRKVGLFQHDPYNWEVLGGRFVPQEALTPGSHIIDRALKSWLADLTPERREEFVDAVYALFEGNALQSLEDVRNPRAIYAVLKTLRHEDEETRAMILDTFHALAKATGRAFRER